MKRFAENSFSFVKHFKIFGIISILLTITGLIGILALPFGVQLFNFDIEFLGGVTMEYDLHTEATPDVINTINGIVKDVTGSYASSIQKTGNSGSSVLLKTLEIDTTLRDEILDRVTAEYPSAEFVDTQFVSSSVGSDLRDAAIKASVLAIILILLYISIRFEPRSGLAAVIALVHDLLVMLSVYVIFQIPMNMNFVAAALTIFGYSINSTIVVFDRIRENAKGISNKSVFSGIVDRSIWQTFSRSINTTITTLIPIILILILGVSSIRNFAIPLAVGIVSGTYSSVCLSGCLWSSFKGNRKKAK